jgi:hypothetical protein
MKITNNEKLDANTWQKAVSIQWSQRQVFSNLQIIDNFYFKNMKRNWKLIIE